MYEDCEKSERKKRSGKDFFRIICQYAKRMFWSTYHTCEMCWRCCIVVICLYILSTLPAPPNTANMNIIAGAGIIYIIGGMLKYVKRV